MANYSDQHFLGKSLDTTRILDKKIAIVTALWNGEVTSKLREGAYQHLMDQGLDPEQVHTWDVPGTFELVYAANKMAFEGYDGVICLGCVIQGETRHFDFICQAVATGITNVGLAFNKPVIFGVLTTLNQEQAFDRAGGKHGNKGVEAAYTALKMIAMQRSIL